jgi:arginyl-tRNA synthetase
MRQRLKTLLDEAIAAAIAAAELPPESADTDFSIDSPPRPELGDFSANAAMALAKVARRAPQQIAQVLLAHLPIDPLVESVEIAPPAFINFHVSQAWFAEAVAGCLKRGEAYGRDDWGAGKRVQVEFVSANPVGPIHIGNARGGPYGDVLASLLEATGHSVAREYYINDGPGPKPSAHPSRPATFRPSARRSSFPRRAIRANTSPTSPPEFLPTTATNIATSLAMVRAPTCSSPSSATA